MSHDGQSRNEGGPPGAARHAPGAPRAADARDNSVYRGILTELLGTFDRWKRREVTAGEVRTTAKAARAIEGFVRLHCEHGPAAVGEALTGLQAASGETLTETPGTARAA